LALVEDSLVFKQTRESIRAEEHPQDWDPGLVDYAFTAWAACGICGQEVSLSGNGGLIPNYEEVEDHPHGGYESFLDGFFLKHSYPALELFPIPEKCPESVAKEVISAFELYWIYRPACAGRLRVALEALMDHLNIQKEIPTNKGGMRELSLHQRIEAYRVIEPILGGNLLALKWLGNTGSHSSVVSKRDILDAFEVFEDALAEIIDKRSEKMAQLAERLRKRHGK